MSALDRFRKPTLDQVARKLELSPFDVVRILVAEDALPRDLRLDPAHLDRIRVRGGLENWWDQPPEPAPGESRSRALVRALLTRMLDRNLVDPAATRADNLFRGLDNDSAAVLRRAVNLLLKEQLLQSRMAAEGLLVSLHPGAVRQLRELAQGSSRTLDSLWDRL